VEETEEKGRVEQRSPAPGAHEPSREGRTMDLVHHGPCLRSMDRELGSTVSRAHAHSQETKPSKSPTAPRGSATARHVSGSARPRPAQIRPCPGLVWTRPMLAVDRSTLTVDLAPHVSGTDTLDPHVRC